LEVTCTVPISSEPPTPEENRQRESTCARHDFRFGRLLAKQEPRPHAYEVALLREVRLILKEDRSLKNFSVASASHTEKGNLTPPSRDERLCVLCANLKSTGMCKFQDGRGCHVYACYKEGRLAFEQALDLRKRYLFFYAELCKFLKLSEENRKLMSSPEGKSLIFAPKKAIDDLLQRYLESGSASKDP